MMEFDQDWFTQGPIDYEFKKYTLMAKIKRLEGMIKLGIIWPVIQEVEYHLDYLYRFKYEKETLDDKLKIAKDIDFINFRIIYEIPDDQIGDQMDVLHRIANEAIVKFEDVYMDARLAWRDIEPHIKITWIPSKTPILKSGFAAMVDNRQKIHLCKFEKPSKLGGDWRTFKLEKIEEVPFTPEAMGKMVEIHTQMDTRIPFARMDYNINCSFEDAIFPIAKSILYSSLMKDFTS
jgi:hypothetical protein